jgi:hypothetical protein
LGLVSKGWGRIMAQKIFKQDTEGIYSYNITSGLEVERRVRHILEIAIWHITPEARVLGPFRGPYDLEIHLNGKRVYVEVKSSLKMNYLIDSANKAFKREHPEPFFVIGVLKLDGRIFLFPEPNKMMKFDEKNLRKILKSLLK